MKLSLKDVKRLSGQLEDCETRINILEGINKEIVETNKRINSIAQMATICLHV